MAMVLKYKQINLNKGINSKMGRVEISGVPIKTLHLSRKVPFRIKVIVLKVNIEF